MTEGLGMKLQAVQLYRAPFSNRHRDLQTNPRYQRIVKIYVVIGAKRYGYRIHDGLGT